MTSKTEHAAGLKTWPESSQELRKKEVKHRLRTAAGEMAREAGMTPSAGFRAGSSQTRNVSPVGP